MAERPAIVHVGAGAGLAWRGQPPAPERLVLIEPNPACLDDLHRLARRRAAAGAETEIVQAAVTGQDGTARLKVLSFADLSGLHDPAPLAPLMPGLRVVDDIAVPAISVATLMTRLALDGSGHRLIVEAFGEEGRILRDLAAAGALDRFAAVTVLTGATRFHDTGLAADEARALLAAQGFRPANPGAPVDPDLPQLHFRRDPALSALRRENAAQAARLERQQAELDRLQREVEAQAGLQAEIARLRAEAAQLRTAESRAQSDLGIALRLQGVAAADLKDLQARYADLAAAKATQDRLLAQLVARLGEASDYLRTRAGADPVAQLPDDPAPQGAGAGAAGTAGHKKAGRRKTARSGR